MSGGFASHLRVTDETISMGPEGGERVMLRVQMPEVWDVIRVDTAAQLPVSELKERSLQLLYDEDAEPSEFLMKLNGLEVLDESSSVAACGARNGSTFLLTFRRRRPVR